MIAAFGTYDARKHPRVAVLVAGLREHGYEVAELNRPLGFSTAERVRMLQQPWRLPLLLVRLLACWAALVGDAARLRRRSGRPEAVLVGYMGHFDVVLARLLFPRSRVVLDHLIFAGDTASDRGATGLRVRLLTVLDRVATACADVVVTDTEEHRAMLRSPRKGVVVRVGASDEWFAAADAAQGTRAEGEPLRVVFFGLYTPLQGAPVIGEAVATALAAGVPLRLTMVGTGQDHAAVRARLDGSAAVTWHDWVGPEDLPALVASHDVCLGIFSDTPKGRRVVPNKVYQGLAAGCVVVTSDTAPQRRTLGEALELVPPADPAALAERLGELAQPERLAQARSRALTGRAAVRPRAVVEPLVAALTVR
jgi:glycosyltransferase involved in cell wall biosynthesis